MLAPDDRNGDARHEICTAFYSRNEPANIFLVLKCVAGGLTKDLGALALTGMPNLHFCKFRPLFICI